MLEETGDYIGIIGEVLELTNGDLLIADAISPVIRRYTSSGRLLAKFGSFGEGPFEFRRISGITESPAGDVSIADSRLSRVTILNHALTPDTAFTVPTRLGRLARTGTSTIAVTYPSSRTTGIQVFTLDWRPAKLISFETPTIIDRPYWNSYATMVLEAAQNHFVVAYSFHYPIYIYDTRGNLQDSIHQTPGHFRIAPVLEPGAFAGTDAESRRKQWFASFDIIADISVIADSLLIVTHGTMSASTQTLGAITTHRSMDAYLLRTLEPLARDIQLPKGGRVLSGGRTLSLLLDGPPAEWTIVKFRPRLNSRGK